MLMTELIEKKRDGAVLADEEIRWMIEGYTKGEIPDYQMSAMLMAIYFSGMNDDETLCLTMSMMESGDVNDLSGIRGVKADKHSTGGVGDKTSLVLCPMLAAQGVKMAKLSGRGLGHTGGTIDKLESFKGLSTSMSMEQFFKNVNEVGFAIAGQTAKLVPADKKLYALRDVTGTVPSRPLIVSSIMSKKLASGADVIVLDVKTGSGAFMKTDDDAFALAEDMVRVGAGAGRKMAAVVTDMDQPLGYTVGNALEVREAISVLKGESGGDLLELCLTLGSNIMLLSGVAADEQEARSRLEQSIADSSALDKLAQFVRAQGGDEKQVYDPSTLPAAAIKLPVRAPLNGFVAAIRADSVGLASLQLGGGRATKESEIDLAVGVVLEKKIGDAVRAGETLAVIHANDDVRAAEAARTVLDAYGFAEAPVCRREFIRGIVR
jgi:pyrimidine-nucleoside phosphorylase